MHVAPAARFDDGVFDLVVFRGEGGKGRLLRQFPLLYSGRHLGLAEVSQQRGVVVEVSSDAESLARDRRRAARTRAGALRVPARGAATARHRRVSGVSSRRSARARPRCRALRASCASTRGRWRGSPRASHCDPPAPPVWDVTTHHRGSPRSTLAYVITLDAINFGSGWFPKLRKRDGRSGYFTVAMGLKDRFDAGRRVERARTRRAVALRSRARDRPGRRRPRSGGVARALCDGAQRSRRVPRAAPCADVSPRSSRRRREAPSDWCARSRR